MRQRVAIAVLSGGVALLGWLGTAPAGAATTATTGATSTTTAPGASLTCVFSREQARATAAIKDRQATLSVLAATVANSAVLTAPDRAALAAQVSSDQATVAGLLTKVSSATTCAALVTDRSAVLSDFRSSSALAREVVIVVTADRETRALTRLQSIAASVASAVAGAQGSGADVTAAQAAAADLTAQLVAAAQATSGVSASALTASTASPATAAATLRSDVSRLRSGAVALRKGEEDVRAVYRTVLFTLRGPAA